MTLLFIVFAVICILQGWGASNRRQGIKYAPAEAAKRQIRQDDEEREAMRRDAQKSRVRFVDSNTGEVLD